jgi:hypothetical protein
MTDANPAEPKPDAATEAQADEWVHDKIAAEREDERAADERIERDVATALEQEHGTSSTEGLIGRIRAALRLR